MKLAIGGFAVAAALLGFAASATAQGTPPVVAAVYQCRTISDDAGRLACFDKAAAELEQAQTARTLVFGDEDDFPRFEGAELKGKIEAVRLNQAGRYVITMPDGTRWLQTEWVRFVFEPKPGDTIVIRRKMVGNYRASTRGSAFQVRQIG